MQLRQTCLLSFHLIGITDWRHLSKDKLINFISILPDVDNEVAIKIIEQFPEFSKNSVEMVNIMRDVCSTALEDDKLITAQSVEAYKQVLDELSSLLKREKTFPSKIENTSPTR